MKGTKLCKTRGVDEGGSGKKIVKCGMEDGNLAWAAVYFSCTPCWQVCDMESMYFDGRVIGELQMLQVLYMCAR